MQRLAFDLWRRDDRLLRAAATLAILVASAVEVFRAFTLGAEPLVVVAVAATLFAVVLASRAWAVALVLASVAPVLAGATGWEPTVSWSCAVLLLFAECVRYGRPVRAALLTAPGVIVGTALAPGDGGAVATTIGAFVAVIAGAAIGSGLRLQRQYRVALEQRAADAVATREVEASRRVAEERLRIARDLHDSVGHQVAVVSMQLGVAEVALPSEATDARAALDAARVSVRNVLSETQNILAVLRTEDRSAAGEDGGSQGRPVPSADRVDELIESFRRLGLRVDAQVALPTTLPAHIGVTVFRVLQESLTNALRHGDGTATVTVAVQGDQLGVQVRNGRRFRPRDEHGEVSGSGLGLVGMRERVEAVGGRVHVGDDGRQFTVSVQMPVGEGER